MSQQLKVTPEQEGKRLDKFLVGNMDGLARNQAKRLIDQGKIKVNGRNAVASHNVQEGEVVEVESLTASASSQGEFSWEDIEVIEDNRDFLVVNKPAGLIVHTSKYIEENTLVYLLLQQYPQLKEVGEYSDRPGIVHRLDKEVSGLLVIAKHQDSFFHLKQQFEQRKVVKRYTCLVHGTPPQENEVVDFHLKRSPKTGKMVAISKKQEAHYENLREARTEYEVARYFKNYTLLKVDLYTGRTHQIRVHLKHAGHPIFNDPEYGGDKILKGTLFSKYKQFVHNCFEVLPRQALHAKTLGFNHPSTGKYIHFDSDTPEDMSKAIEKWKHYIAYRE